MCVFLKSAIALSLSIDVGYFTLSDIIIPTGELPGFKIIFGFSNLRIYTVYVVPPAVIVTVLLYPSFTVLSNSARSNKSDEYFLASDAVTLTLAELTVTVGFSDELTSILICSVSLGTLT